MCLAFPAEVISIDHDSVPRSGIVALDGVRTTVCMEWVPEAVPGDFVIVHVGFAISRLDVNEARQTLKMIGETLNRIEQEDALH